ncbi:MAG: hypothetical protein HC916_06355 [Coleofasciculaceae cyanobacterium SM2_1_6]|nr:hypothetical protein [Coleofasciculaceae cyanobacterium SM2_1_6]
MHGVLDKQITKKMTNGNPLTGSGTNNNGNDRLDLLIDQIGRLTEQIAQSNMAIAHGFAESRANIEKLGEKIDSGFAESRANIEKLGEKIDSGFAQTSANIERLGERLEAKIDRLVVVTDRQAETVAKQAQTVDRLSLMLEQLLSNSQ